MRSRTFKMLGLFVIINVTTSLHSIEVSELADVVNEHITVDSYKDKNAEQLKDNILGELSKEYEMHPGIPPERKVQFQEEAAAQYKDTINVGDEITFFYFSRGINHKVSGKFYGKSPTSNTVIINSTYIPIVDLPPDVKTKMFPETKGLAEVDYVKGEVEKWKRNNKDIKFKKEKYVFWKDEWYSPSDMVNLLITARIRTVKREIAEREREIRKKIAAKFQLENYMTRGEIINASKQEQEVAESILNQRIMGMTTLAIFSDSGLKIYTRRSPFIYKLLVRLLESEPQCGYQSTPEYVLAPATEQWKIDAHHAFPDLF